MRIHHDEGPGHFGHLAQGEAGFPAGCHDRGLAGLDVGVAADIALGRHGSDRRHHYHVAGSDHVTGAAWEWAEGTIGIAPPSPAHLRKWDLPGVGIGKADRRRAGCGAQHNRQTPANVDRDRRNVNLAQPGRPITLGVDLSDGPAPTFVRMSIADQSLAQGLVRLCLQTRIETGAYRQAGLVQCPLAIPREQLAPHLLGKIGRSDLIGLLAVVQFDRLRLSLVRRLAANDAVLDHTVENPVAARRRRLRQAHRIIAVWRLGQSAEEGSLSQGQLVERFIEIGHRRRRDAISARAEIDLVQIEFEYALLGQRRLDLGGEQDLLYFARDRNLIRQQHVLGDLLGDRRRPDRTAAGSKPADIGDRGA